MAPPNGSVRGRKAGTGSYRPKPALPLTYAQRKAAAAAARDASVASSTASSATELHSPSSQATSTQPDVKTDARQATEVSRGVPDAATSHDETCELPPSSESSTDHLDSANGRACIETGHGAHNPSGEITREIRPTIPAEKQTTHDSHIVRLPAADHHASNGRYSSRPEPKSETRVNTSAHALKSVDQHAVAAKAANGRPLPAVSPSRYPIPPPFQPVPRPYGFMANGDVARGPRPPMHNGAAHQARYSHPSNGSIHFGTLQNSQNSSPVPLHSGGIVAPPAMPPMVDSRTPYMPPPGNGYPPMMPYGADMMQPADFEHYGRPAMGFGPMDAFPGYGTNMNFAPSTPHSFHESHSSGQLEDKPIYQAYPTNGHYNGGGTGPGELDGPGHGQHERLFMPLDYPRMMHGQGQGHSNSHSNGYTNGHSNGYGDGHSNGHGPQDQPFLPDSDGDRLVDYMQQHFGDSEFADCTLELRYVDDRAAPVRIPGHRLVFARSRVLSALLGSQTLPLTLSDRNSHTHTLLLETGDKWLRSDSFYMSVQRLYGLPLLPLPARGRPGSQHTFADVGTTSDQLDFALSYAAAGHLLGWAPIVRRGCEVATQLLSWHTMEKLMEFALEGHVDNGSGDSFKYGDGSRILLNALVTFIVHNLPPTFTLDVSSRDPKSYARLPEHAPPPPSHSPAPPSPPPAPPPRPKSVKKSAATIRGSSIPFGKGHRSRQIAGIQFGDLSLGEEVIPSDAETPKAAPQAQPMESAVLSRALINLPFSHLKMILESASSGNVNGWANADSRYRIIRSAVEEREARRLRALNAVLGDRVPEAEGIRVALGNPSPQDMGPWSALGWQEEVLPYGNADGPSLGRKWVPVLPGVRDTAAAYP
ncbi:hypothetical protein E4U40_000196 [Claviceps sp. LM458 group G5]|nr:hypothetical protein E4U40_000196 [Claviceps sp. LM458 group G5]